MKKFALPEGRSWTKKLKYNHLKLAIALTEIFGEIQVATIIHKDINPSNEEQTVALEAGCDDLIRKPLCEADIFDVMNKYIGVRYVDDESAFEPNSTTQPRTSQT